jgi:AbrB family looped-hinge helix DNA binding protein
METTKLSTRGQIVIPEQLRTDIKEGTVFVVTRQNDLIILKKVEGLTKEEMEEMKELDKIWKDIDEGKCETHTVEEFFKEMKTW